MRFIEDLRNKHAGKEIWIIGCGLSLDDFPDEFFDDKISIAVNWSFIRFSQPNYFLFCHDLMPSLIRQLRPDLMPRCAYQRGFVPCEMLYEKKTRKRRKEK